MTAAYSRIVPRRGETMSDGDVTEVEVVLDGVRFYVEARQDDTEHEVGSTITEGLGSAMDAIKTLAVMSPTRSRPSSLTISASNSDLNSSWNRARWWQCWYGEVRRPTSP